jgi:hypothetical protein
MMDADDDDYNNDHNADGVFIDPQMDLNNSGKEAGDGDDSVQIRTPTTTGGTTTGGRGHGRGGGGRGRGRGRGEGGHGRGRGRGRGCGEGGRPPGCSNYSNNELDLLLESVREILPISGREWEEVATRQASYFSDSRRTGEQLKKKYNRLAKTKIPTGDPNCPPSVREAKRISRLIVEKTNGTAGDEEDIFSPDDDGDKDDDKGDNDNDEGNEEEATREDRAGNVGDVEDVEDESRAAGRRRGPTPVTNRRKQNRDSDKGEPTFNDIMLMIANQQASEQRDRQEHRIAKQEECERRYEELREDRQMQMHALHAQMQQQTNLMTMMMMTMGGRGRAFNNVESEINNVVDTQLTTDVAVEEIIENRDNDQE